MAKRSAARIRELKSQFDEAHRKGMKGLQSGDYEALTEAVNSEKTILEEQAALIDDHLAHAQTARAPRAKRPKRR